ncbi:D-alanyl-D-alanine carboxypeptidase, partial [Anaerobutyricum hallii]|nr:D-alanyl-D-alanine carboxypeptidase [Anaerobutyricum hallii]
MKHTHFVNCCGLDADGHYTSARDIALMSRELITNHPDIFHYTTIWMENITHVTKRGESEFGLSNTNKLLRHYQGATGLKTGSTSKAGFCLSATAERNHISLIAVVMACQSAKERVKDCVSLLDYGFSLCKIYTDKQPP